MSASEKLRTLERDWHKLVDQDVLVNSLPQIRAVVEAADEARRQAELWAEDADDGEFAIWNKDEFMAALFALRPALADLDEALP